MSKLGLFLDNMRREVQRKKLQFENLGKPHSFPCPYCSAYCTVAYKPDGVSYTLRHPPSECVVYAKPDKNTRGDLLNAFIFHCRPKHRFGSLEGFDTLDKELDK